jgi:hypothetical protein
MVAFVLGVGGAGAVAQQAKDAVEARPISSMAWLVGGVWTADASKLGAGMQRIETRYQWSDNGSYVRFTTHFVSTAGTAKTYDGNFYWDPTAKTLAMWYMDAKNVITEGSVSGDGAVWQISFKGIDFGGKPAEFRVDVTKKTSDLYHWALNEKAADGWQKLFELDYVRKAEGLSAAGN